MAGWDVFVWESASCICGLRQRNVCTYTTGRIPAIETKELGDVLEVGGPSMLQDTGEGGIAVAIKAGDRLGDGALRGFTSGRRRAVGRALGLLLRLSALLGWTGHAAD
jgi:hypothetical protein